MPTVMAPDDLRKVSHPLYRQHRVHERESHSRRVAEALGIGRQRLGGTRFRGRVHRRLRDAVRPSVQTDSHRLLFCSPGAARDARTATLRNAADRSVRRVEQKLVIRETVDRRGLWLAQTRTSFRRVVRADAYSRRAENGGRESPAKLVEAAGHPVSVVGEEFRPMSKSRRKRPGIGRGHSDWSRPRTGKADRPFHPFAERGNVEVGAGVSESHQRRKSC